MPLYNSLVFFEVNALSFHQVFDHEKCLPGKLQLYPQWEMSSVSELPPSTSTVFIQHLYLFLDFEKGFIAVFTSMLLKLLRSLGCHVKGGRLQWLYCQFRQLLQEPGNLFFMPTSVRFPSTYPGFKANVCSVWSTVCFLHKYVWWYIIITIVQSYTRKDQEFVAVCTMPTSTNEGWILFPGIAW